MKRIYEQPQSEMICVETDDLLTLSNAGNTDGMILDWEDKQLLPKL